MRNEIRNIRDVWLEGYRRLLKQAQAEGRIVPNADPHERRRHPRFLVQTADVSTPREHPLAVCDLSWCGVAFDSDQEYFPQRPLTLELAGVFSTEAEVLACDRRPEAGANPHRYRVRCRFRDEAHGLQFLTLALELHEIERD
jgi:hypothetical protein